MNNKELIGQSIGNADCVGFDFDDTIVCHDPEYQRFLILHALLLDHDPNAEVALNQFAINYLNFSGKPYESSDYISQIRDTSAKYAGGSAIFEDTASDLINTAHNGSKLRNSLLSLPKYRFESSDRSFWNTRAAIINESGVPLEMGKSLAEGFIAFHGLITQLGKESVVISNSRTCVVRPVAEALLRSESVSFTEIVTLADSPHLQRKPSPSSMIDLRQRLGFDQVVYIGNAQEDIEFCSSSNTPGAIVSPLIFSDPVNEIAFFEDFSDISASVEKMLTS